MTKGMLFSQMTPPEAEVVDFHDWYQTEHIPARMDIDGFSHAIRYQLDGPERGFLAVYFIDNLDCLNSDEYRELKTDPSDRTSHFLKAVSGFTRYIAEEISDTGHVDMHEAGSLFVVAFAVPDSDVAEFEDWYEGEHVPLLMKVPGWQRIRRYRARPGSDGPGWTHFALHEIRDVDVLNAPEREAARTTAQRDALANRSWFDSGRWTYTPIHFAVSASKEN